MTKTRFRAMIKDSLANRKVAIGLMIIFVLIITSIFAGSIAPKNPAKMDILSTFHVMASNLGMVFGPFIGGTLYFVGFNYLGLSEKSSFKFPFYFSAVIALIGVILVWINVTDAKAPRTDELKMSLSKLSHPDGVDRQGLLNLSVLYANAFMEGFAFASIGPLMAYYLPRRFDIEPDLVAIVVGIAMGVGALVAYPAGRMSDRIGRKKLFILGRVIAFGGVMGHHFKRG